MHWDIFSEFIHNEMNIFTILNAGWELDAKGFHAARGLECVHEFFFCGGFPVITGCNPFLHHIMDAPGELILRK